MSDITNKTDWERARSLTERLTKNMAPEAIHNEPTRRETALLCHVMLLSSVMDRSANRFAEQNGLTMTQWMALGCIGNGGAEGIRHTDLGQRLMLSKSPVTGVVDRLERSGYVERLNDPTDRRAARIVMTKSGLAAWMSVRDTLNEHARQLCRGLHASQQDDFLALMGRILENSVSDDPNLCKAYFICDGDEAASPTDNG